MKLTHPNIMLVGADRKAYASKAPRLSIISFNIKFEDATNNVSAEGFEDAGIFMLNPHYVIALLNDVYVWHVAPFEFACDEHTH